MKTRTLRIVVAMMLMFATIAGTASTVDLVSAVKSSSQIAARYHLRSRTSNFFKRASSGRTTSRGLFGR